MLYTKDQAKERAAQLNKVEGVKASVGHHVTNGEDHYPVHILSDEGATTESGR